MVPASFDQDNKVLDKPPDMDDCTALSVFQGVDVDQRPVVISCWKVTQAELNEILRTGRVWLVVYGMGMPPVALMGTSPWPDIEVKEPQV